ncbi:MAG TPA: type II toxin-antitoxin system RelE/ParE family toxin [Solirubrobacteraceae bacterium]|nr:type II toxin-antitoxin system RelE/ParE family toxin [Solirubrobacteraceae bacterium]
MSEGPWRLVVASPAARDVERLPEKYATAVLALLPVIAANPHRLGKPLRFELEGLWSARRGPYRVIYAIDDAAHAVYVHAIDHRSNAYRRR